MTTSQIYQTPMQPWPPLAPLGKTTRLPDLALDLFYFEAGSPKAPSLIMIHGLGDEADTWRHVFLPLSERFHVIALDLPGFGRSEKIEGAYTPDLMKSAIVGLMDHLNIEKAFLMGSSLGGILAHSIAIEHPERGNGLVLVDGALLQQQKMGDISMRLMALPLLGEWFYTHLRKDPQAAFDSMRNVYHDLDGLPPADREFLFTRVNQRVWSDGQRRAYFSTLRQLAPWVKHAQKNLPEQLHALTTPTLVLRGEHDSLFSAENADAIIAAQPFAEAVTLPGIGHLPHQENPSVFLQVVERWLIRQV